MAAPVLSQFLRQLLIVFRQSQITNLFIEQAQHNVLVEQELGWIVRVTVILTDTGNVVEPIQKPPCLPAVAPEKFHVIAVRPLFFALQTTFSGKTGFCKGCERKISGCHRRLRPIVLPECTDHL